MTLPKETPMIERLTRIVSNGCYDGTPSAEIARAVLTALMEPTPGMVADGASALTGCPPWAYEATICWQAMLTAALNEGEG